MSHFSSTAKAMSPDDRPWLRHYDPGVPHSIEYPDHPLHTFLERAALNFPDRACTILGESITTYAEMDGITNRIASALLSLGLVRGDRVGILIPNTQQFVMAFYGILKAGCVVVATNPLYSGPEIVHQLKDSGVSTVFVDADLYRSLKSIQPETGIERIVVVGPRDGANPQERKAGGAAAGASPGVDSAQLLEPADIRLHDILGHGRAASRVAAEVRPDDIALFQYSGGTTGISKAAVASHRGVVANTMQFRRWLVPLREGRETILLAIPLYHAYGMIAGMSLGISIGASLALVPNPRDISGLLGTIRASRPTVFPGVPTLYNAISNHPDIISGSVDLKSISICISGSTALLRETKERFEALSGGKICEGYGLSEAPVVTHCNPLLGRNKIGSIGMPMPDVDCRIVDPDDGERDAAAGESGELILRGPQLMIGYHNMPAETEIALRTLKDGKTWLFTGDIVRMDADGYFYVVDRKKELIKPGGFQVWPREVEEVLAAHPAVLEVGVAGVPDPDRGEAVKAWIVLRQGATVSEGELQVWCKERLAHYKVPSFIVLRSQLPKSNVGKILRRELVREHLQSAAGSS